MNVLCLIGAAYACIIIYCTIRGCVKDERECRELEKGDEK